LLRTGANYYDEENSNPDLLSFEGRVSSFLQKCGLDYRRLRQVWSQNGASLDRISEGEARDEALRHLDTIVSLELKKSGNARRLLEIYGIENYGRYGAEVLQRQLDEESDLTSPYGVIMYAKADFEGSGFRSTDIGMNEHKKLSRLQEDLRKEGHLLRIVEVGSKTAILHRTLRLKKMYEVTAGKIKFGAIAAHGSEIKVIFRESRKGGDWNSRLYIEDIYKLMYPKSDIEERNSKAFEEFRSSFDEGVDFILMSCSTAGGEEDNIARAGSRATSFAVTGPRNISRETFVRVFKQNGKLRLSQYYSVPRRTYRSGSEEEIDEYAA